MLLLVARRYTFQPPSQSVEEPQYQDLGSAYQGTLGTTRTRPAAYQDVYRSFRQAQRLHASCPNNRRVEEDYFAMGSSTFRTRLSLCFQYHSSSPLTLEAPYLHDLSFVNTPSPLRCVRLPWRQLTTLKVHFDTTQLSYFQFVAILVHTEALINLYLVLRSTERVPQGFKAIKLPKLQHLQIGEFLGEGVSSEFLAGVDTPSLIAMQVAWIIPGRRNSQDLVRDAMNSIQSFIVNNRNLRSVKLLACYNGQFGRTLFGDGDLNAFRLPRPANGSAIGSVELAPATPLSMRIDDTHWTKCVPHLKRTDIFDGLRSVAYANQLGENMSHHRMSSFFEQAATHRDGHGGPPESFFALDDRLIMVLFTIRSLMCCAQGLEEADVYIAF
jgi:hypothetical protein